MQPLVAIDRRRVGVAVDDRRDPDRVVVAEELDQPPILVLLRRLLVRRLFLDVAGAVAKNAGRLAGLRVFLDLARALDLEVLVDAAELERQRVERGVGPGREQDGVLGRGLVELVAGRVALFLEPGDEDLADDDPASGPDGLGPGADVIEHIRDRLHLGDRMVELGHAGVGRVRVRIDQARQDHLAGEVDDRRLRAACLQHVLVGADADQTVALDGQGLGNREVAIDRDDLPVMEDQVGFLGRRRRSVRERRAVASKREQPLPHAENDHRAGSSWRGVRELPIRRECDRSAHRHIFAGASIRRQPARA